MEFIDNGMRVRGINGSEKHFIREDGMKLTKKANGTYKYSSGYVHGSGYLVVSIGDGKSEAVHRVVAKEFIPNPNNYPMVDHKDNCRTNAHYTNLRWCTNKQNMDFYHTEQKGTHKQTKKVVDTTDLTIQTSKVSELTDKVLKLEARNTLLLKALKDSINGLPLPEELSYLQPSGNLVIVDNREFKSAGAAASYIVGKEAAIGNTRTKGTISKELRRYLQGKRDQWEMYGKYTIGY